MKITIHGPAAAVDVERDVEILDPEVLRRFDGIKSEDSCIEYLDEPLGEIGLIGGHLEFTFDEESQRLRIRTVYHSPRKLKKKELDQLVAETRGQWSDGIGEGDFETGDEHVSLDPFPMLSEVVDTNDVTVEQVDDGVKVPRPKKSPLFAAVKKNDVAKIAKLLDAGEPIESRDRDRNTPLLFCMWHGELREEAALLLIARGADPNVSNKHARTPVFFATIHGYTMVLKSLLEAGAHPNYVDPNDYTEHYPLHMACNRRQGEAVRLLVEHGADVNRACSSGYTPLLHVHEEDVEIARFLVEQGADVDARDAFGKGLKAKLKAALQS